MQNNMWVARNKNGTLKLFTSVKPWRDLDCKSEEQQWITDESTDTECILDPYLFPDLEWESDPLKVRLICT